MTATSCLSPTAPTRPSTSTCFASKSTTSSCTSRTWATSTTRAGSPCIRAVCHTSRRPRGSRSSRKWSAWAAIWTKRPSWGRGRSTGVGRRCIWRQPTASSPSSTSCWHVAPTQIAATRLDTRPRSRPATAASPPSSAASSRPALDSTMCPQRKPLRRAPLSPPLHTARSASLPAAALC